MRILALCLSMINDAKEENKFEQLYWEYKELLFYCAMNKIHDEHRAEDAVNITFMHVAQNMHMIEDAISPRTKRLLVTIVERTAINMYKKYQKEYNRTLNIEDVDPELFIGYQEEDKLLAQAILKLPLNYRQVIILKFSQGYRTEEIAAILDYSLEKTKKLISRGKKKLEKLLEEEDMQ